MRFHLLALAFLPTLLAQGAGAAETEVATQEGQEAETLATKTNNNDIADVDLDPIAPAKEDAAKESTNDSKDLFADFKFPTDEKPTTTASDDFFGEEASKEATATDEPEALPSLDDFLTSPTTPKETEEKTSDDETTTAEDTVKEDATEEEAAKEDGTEEETTDLTPASTKKDLHLGFGGPQTGPCIYNVIIKTGNKRYAGTDADVFVQFGDGHGRSVNAFLDRPYRNDFERNALNQFTVNSVVTIPDICSLVIGHNRKHPGSDW